MENFEQIARLLSICVSSLGLIYLALKFRQQRLDGFRQNVFILRDELFDYAAKGNISFEHPAYGMLRTMMNGYIRFSHKISLTQFVVVSIMTMLFNKEFIETGFESKWQNSLSDLDEKTKNEMLEFERRASMELFGFVFLSSISKKLLILTPVVALATIVLIASKAMKTKSVRTKDENLEAIAYAYSTQSEKVKDSLDIFNDGAYAYGKMA